MPSRPPATHLKSRLSKDSRQRELVEYESMIREIEMRDRGVQMHDVIHAMNVLREVLDTPYYAPIHKKVDRHMLSLYKILEGVVNDKPNKRLELELRVVVAQVHLLVHLNK